MIRELSIGIVWSWLQSAWEGVKASFGLGLGLGRGLGLGLGLGLGAGVGVLDFAQQ